MARCFVVNCSPVHLLTFAIHLLLMSRIAVGNGDFLTARKVVQNSFENALAEVRGCGIGNVDISKVEKALMPVWPVLPKNAEGLIEWRMMRYVAHRYFMQQSSLMIRGFEPMRQINTSQKVRLLTENTHAGVHAALEGQGSTDGFTFDDTVTVIATLEQLIRDEETTLLEFVYKESRRSLDTDLRYNELMRLLEDYVVYWMLQEDLKEARIVVGNRKLVHEVVPKWTSIEQLVRGAVQNMRFQRSHAAGSSSTPFKAVYSFEDARKVVSAITGKFASFWDSECKTIKEELLSMDTSGTGRVSLSAFYGANTDGVWHFAESEAYLREVGALDETSTLRGKQVIIPNYLQAPSNCIVTSPQYLVCCVNECEEVLNELEDAIGGPLASPDEIIELVSKMTNFVDEPPKISSSLRAQLNTITKTHGGRVPLHGRLFAQWLHFVFPQECPFPHKSGTRSLTTPVQFGDNLLANQDEIDHHVSKLNASGAATFRNHTVEFTEAHWMSQWSEDEELMADYSLQLRAPWDLSYPVTLSSLSACAIVLAAIGRVILAHDVDSLDSKSHFV